MVSEKKKIQVRIPIDKLSTGLRTLESLCWEMLYP